MSKQTAWCDVVTPGSLPGMEGERNVFKCTGEGTARCRWEAKGQRGQDETAVKLLKTIKINVLQQTEEIILHLISTCHTAPLTAGRRQHLLRLQRGKPWWTLGPTFELVPPTAISGWAQCARASAHTHIRAAASTVVEKKRNKHFSFHPLKSLKNPFFSFFRRPLRT